MCLFLSIPMSNKCFVPAKCFSTASRSRLLLARRRAGRAGRHRPVCWSELATTQAAAVRSSWQQHWERALHEHILHHHELSHGVRLQRPVWWRSGDTIAQPLTHEEVALAKTPRATPASQAAPPTPAAALVEDEPSSSTAKRRKVLVDPIVRDWFFFVSHQ